MRGFFRHFLIALVVLALPACGQGNIRTFRYQLTVEVEQDGRPQTASSIIEARYLLGNRDGNGLRWHSTIKGTAPILDLGSDGTLVAAFDYDAEDLQKRQTISDRWPPYRMPFDFAGIPLGAYRLETPNTIETMRGLAVLDPKYYPIFVWIPPSGNWREARQMFYDEIATRATPRIRVTKITVEAAPQDPLPTKIEAPPAWLLQTREYFDMSDSGTGYYQRVQKDNWGKRYQFSPGHIEKG
jgi:hypothetical protein